MKKMICLIIFSSLFIGLNAYSTNGVSRRDLRMISLAFANGAVEITNLDIEQIQALKKDERLLKEKVYALTSDYIELVQALNSVERAEEVKPGYNFFNH